MDVRQCKPIRKKILIAAYEWPDKSEGGIFLPQSMKYDPRQGGYDPWRGKILRIGDEVTQVKVGEIVRYQPDNYTKDTVEQDGVRYIILDEILIYAVEDENENLVRALENRVVFEPEELPNKYGKLYLPDKREEPLLYGIIAVAGLKSGVVKGDRCCIQNRSTWQYFNSAGKRYILTDRSNLLAIVNKEG